MQLNSENYDYPGYEKLSYNNFYGCYDSVEPSSYAQQLHHNAITPQSHYNQHRYVSPYDRSDKRHNISARSGPHSLSPTGNTASLIDSAKQYGLYDPISAAASPALSSSQTNGNSPPSDYHSGQHPSAGYPVPSLTPSSLPKSGYPTNNDNDFSAASPGGCKIPPPTHNGVGPAGHSADVYSGASSLPGNGSPVGNINSLAGGLSGSSNQSFLSSMGNSFHHQQSAGAPPNMPTIYSWMRQGSGKFDILVRFVSNLYCKCFYLFNKNVNIFNI